MYEYGAKLLKTVDGDTASLMLDLGFNIHLEVEVRFKGINAPETHSTNPLEKEAALHAAAQLNLLLARGPLTVKTERTSKNDIGDKQEKYGRYLATVINGAGLNVNEEMLKTGNAISYDGSGARPAWPWKKA